MIYNYISLVVLHEICKSEHYSFNCSKNAFFIKELLRITNKGNQTTVDNLIKNLIKV